MKTGYLHMRKQRCKSAVQFWASLLFEPHHEKTVFFANAKTKTQISFAVTAKLISAFVSTTWIVQSLYFLNPKCQASSHLLWQYSPVCVRPGRKPEHWFSHVSAHLQMLLTGNKGKILSMFALCTGSHIVTLTYKDLT